MTDSRSIHISTNDPLSFLLMAEYYSIIYIYIHTHIHTYTYIHTISSLSIYLSIDILVVSMSWLL